MPMWGVTSWWSDRGWIGDDAAEGKRDKHRKKKLVRKTKQKPKQHQTNHKNVNRVEKVSKKRGYIFRRRKTRSEGEGGEEEKWEESAKWGAALRNDAFVTVFCVTLAVFLLDRSFGRRRQGVSEVAVSEVLPFI